MKTSDALAIALAGLASVLLFSIPAVRRWQGRREKKALAALRRGEERGRALGARLGRAARRLLKRR